jgi:hypothetical protein
LHHGFRSQWNWQARHVRSCTNRDWLQHPILVERPHLRP